MEENSYNQHGSRLTPVKRVELSNGMGLTVLLENLDGVTMSSYGDFRIVQNRGGFDQMVNALVYLFGYEIVSVHYYTREGQQIDV